MSAAAFIREAPGAAPALRPTTAAAVLIFSVVGLSGCALPFGSTPAPEAPALSPEASGAPLVVDPVPAGDAGAAMLVEDGRVRLDRCVREALTKNLDVRIAELKAAEADTQIAVRKSAFDPRIDAVGASFPEASWDKQYNVSAQKRFFTGTEVRAEAGTLFLNNTDRTEGTTTAERQATLRVRQPLLRGANWGVNLGGIHSARIMAQNADATIEAQVLEMLKAAESTYWTAAYGLHLWRTQRAGLKRAEEVLKLVKIRRDAEAATALDVLEAEAAVAAATDEVLRAQKQHLDSVALLWQIVGQEVREPGDDLDFAPLTAAELLAAEPDPEVSYATALRQSPVSVLLANEIALQDIQFRQAKDRLLPQVDLEVNTGTGDFFQHYTRSGETSGWNVMLRVGLPWTFRAERAQLDAARVRLESSEVARTQALRQLKLQIHETCREITTGTQQVLAASRAADVNRRKWDEQFRRYGEGLTSVRDLLESEGEYRKADAREQEARLRLILAAILLGRLEGSLPDRHQMTL